MGSEPLIVVQARMSSTRLPGKVMADVAGEPLLELMLKRLEPATTAGLVVATTVEPLDDPIAALARRLGLRVARGPRDDVLHRFVLAIGSHPGPIVRLTADCPLIDPAIVDATVGLFAATPKCAYASVVRPRVVPNGLDVEVVDAAALRALDAEPLTAAQREHVTLALSEAPDRFPAASLPGDPALGELCWTVDEAADLAFVRALVGRLGPRRHRAGLSEMLAAARRPPALGQADRTTRV